MRKLTAVILGIIVTVGLLASPTTAADAKAKKPSPITVTPATPVRGVPFTLTGKIGTKVKRPVSAQYLSGKTWKALVTGKTSAKGTYVLKAKTSSASLTVRVVAKKTRIKHKTYPTLTTKSRTITTRTVSAPTLVTTTLPMGAPSITYSATVTASAGAIPYHWSATGLPAGLSLNAATGVISGKPGQSGIFSVEVTVASHYGSASTRSLALRILPASGLIAAGFGHTCAITSVGGLKCWGDNSHGELGGGAIAEWWTPYPVVGLTSGVVAVAAGGEHSCALVNTGAVYCWGWNSNGQVGDGTITDRFSAVAVSGVTNAIAITAGQAHSCAVLASGQAECWGANTYGQLGDGTVTDQHLPVLVAGTTSWVSIGAGVQHTCGLSSTGAVLCWGRNLNHQIGDTTTAERDTPTPVMGLSSGMTSIAVGSYHSCAARTDGVRCWGDDGFGELGDATTGSPSSPVTTNGFSAPPSVLAAGYGHTCAVASGAVTCWGINTSGQLGDTTTTSRSVPTQVTGLASGYLAVAAGQAHSCALSLAGTVRCWGTDTHGQLGNNTTASTVATPVTVTGFN